MSTSMTRGRYRYDVLCRVTGSFLYSTSSDVVAAVPKPTEVVHDSVTGAVSYGVSMEG